MSSHAEKIVARFLRQEQCSKGIVKYVLRHSGKGARGNDVETFDIVESLSVDELDNLANLILGRAQLDADGFGPSLQRYTLTSFLPEDKTSGRISFRLKGIPDVDLDSDDESGEEAPTMRGLTQQLMRHNEANNRTMVGSMGAMMNLMVRRMESQDKVIEKMSEDRVRTFEVIEEAMSKKHEREMEALAETAKQERITLGIKKVSMLIPVMMDRIAGGKGKVTDKSDPMVLMLEELVSSMNTEQMETIRKSLTSEQQIVFYNVLKRFGERKQLTNGESASDKKEN